MEGKEKLWLIKSCVAWVFFFFYELKADLLF